LAEFPLHGDLAHWAVAPRYFMLRCIVGSNDVFTSVLSWASIVDKIGPLLLGRAVFTVRKHKRGYSSLMRILAVCGGFEILRWDALMKKLWIGCLIGVLLLGSAARSQAQQTGATEKAVAALEEQWLQSQKTNNPEQLVPLLAEKFVSTN